jgi:uncharacterized protein (DUF1778 family)
MAMHSNRSEKLDFRITPEAKAALYAAARVKSRSLSEFVLESALARADETLAERNRFGLNAEQWEAFQVALNAEPRSLPNVARLLREPGVFDSSTTR